MKIIPYADMLVATIQHLFPKGTPQVQGKVFATSFRIDIDDVTRRVRKPPVLGYVHLAIIAERNYVKVFAASTEMPCGYKHINNWTLACDHDSAWRDDGVRDSMRAAYRKLLAAAAQRFNRTEDALFVAIRVEEMGILPCADVFGDTLPETAKAA